MLMFKYGCYTPVRAELFSNYSSNDDRIGAMNLRQKEIEYHNGITA